MRVKIHYEDGRSSSVFSNSLVETKFKIKVNKMPVTDLSFSESKTFFLENTQVFENKKNVIRFRHVAPDEKEAQTKAVVSNIFRGILFIIMLVILPFGFMRFKSVKIPFHKLKFEYSSEHDFVLLLSPLEFAYRFDPKDLSIIDIYSENDIAAIESV